MTKQLIIVCLSALVLSACTSPAPEVQTGPDAEVIMGNLHRVDNTRASLAFVDPEADFSKYNRVMLDPLDVDNVEIVQPTRSVTNRSGAWQLSDTDKDNLRRHYREVFTRELQETGDYEIVDEPGADVLRISATITGIAPTAARDDTRSRAIGRSRVYTEGGGTMSIGFAFSDSKSGDVLGIVKDRRGGSPVWGVNNSVTNMSDVRFIFSGWARQIRSRLDIMHGY
jgi:hypothetical protein